jgi:multidrug efflux pump
VLAAAKHEEKHSRIYNLIEGWIVALTNGYRRALGAVLRARWTVIVAWTAVLGLGAVFFLLLKAELSPVEDRGVVFGLVTAPQGSTPQYTGDQIRPIEDLYAQIPEASAYTAIAGFPTVVDGSAVLRLKPWEQRTRKQQQIAEELRPQFQKIPGAIAFPDQSALARAVVPQHADRLHRDVADSLCGAAALVDRFLDEVRKEPRIQNLQIDLRLNTPEVRVAINRDKLSDIGVSVDTVGRTLETMLGGRQVTRFKREGEQYDVIVQVAPIDRTTPADISDSYVRARDGGMVQLSNLVGVKEGVAPQSLNHFNRLRAVRITGTLMPGYTIDEALKFMDDAARRVLPTTAQTDLDNQSREFRASGKEIYFTFVLAPAVHLSRSVRPVRELRAPVRDHALGAAVHDRRAARAVLHRRHASTFTARSVSSRWSALITKHGILIVEFSNQLREKGEALVDAVIDAATLRLRPILMTTGAMVLGAVPLALATAPGRSRAPRSAG